MGLREIKPGYDVYLHGDPALGVSSTFNSGIIVTSEGVVALDALGSEAIARQAFRFRKLGAREQKRFSKS